MRFPFFKRKPKPVRNPAAVLAPYGRPTFAQRHRKLMLSILIFAAFFYGAAYSFTTTYFLVQLIVPLVPLILLVIWALPDRELGESRLVEWMLFLFLAVLLAWPDYLAIALPGMPWITAVRLVVVPLALVFLVRLAQSPRDRHELAEILSAAPAIWKLVAAYSLIALFSIAFSGSVMFSVNKYIVAMLYWVMIFFVSVKVFTRPGTVERLAYLLWVAVIYVCLIGIQEARHSVVPWAGHIPSFLKVQDESVQRILAGATRAATGIYRVQSKFTTSLGLAEFLAYALPFLLHLMFTARRRLVSVAVAATLPLLLYTVIKTDARLGMVGFFSSILLYALFLGASRWRQDKRSIFGPATVLAFPTVATMFFISTFYVGRLRAMIWGTGAQSFSTESRKQQVAEGIPKILSHPWGYGFGRGADVLGFTNGAGVLTIDTYYLAVALELGVIGFLVYYSIFITATVRAGLRSYRVAGEESYLGPAAIAMVNFIIIKSIFSQVENHPLVFAMLGMIVALIYRVDRLGWGLPRNRHEPSVTATG